VDVSSFVIIFHSIIDTQFFGEILFNRHQREGKDGRRNKKGEVKKRK
jgi:hypothetical protein